MPIDVPARDRCAFCSFVEDTSRFAIVEELPDSIAWLPPRQHGLGHVLIIPKRHVSTIVELQRAEATMIMEHVHRVARAIAQAFDPSGLNVFQNNGTTAGQTVPHYHVHIVPTYAGDPPGRIFKSEEFDRVPHEELLETASRIAAHLEPTDS